MDPPRQTPTRHAEACATAGRRVTLLGAVVDLGLALLKAFVGLVSGSAALLADAAHSLSDLASDVVTLVTLRAAARPADEDHPYGHGRYETVGTVVLALLLAGTAVGIAVDAWGRLDDAVEPGSLALWAAAVSVVVKELLFHVSVRVGRRCASALLVANAWHHRTDALSSVAAFGGIAAARLGFPVLDPIAAIVVAALIGHVALRLFRDAGREVTESALSGDVMQRLETGIRALPGVVALHELRARRMGRNVLVDLHVEVKGSTTVSDGHQVAERVRKFVFDAYEPVSEVLVHIDPEPDEHLAAGQYLAPPRAEIEALVREVAAELPAVRAVTHVQPHFLGRRTSVHVGIALDDGLRVREASGVARDLRRRLEALEEIEHADIHLELDDRAHEERP